MAVGARGFRQFLLYVVLDIVCVGVGMGVPALAILLGLVVGWRIVGMLSLSTRPVADALARVLFWAGMTSGVTLAIMVAIWGRCLPLLFDPAFDVANFGMPLLLFEPRASFIGWLVLMIVVSPVLQFLLTVLGAHLALLRKARKRTGKERLA